MSHDMVVLIGISGVAFITILILSASVMFYRMKLDALKQGVGGGMTSEDRELLQAVLGSIQRIEERVEALETLAMEREREEKFGMRL
jgi:hypothetical protein